MARVARSPDDYARVYEAILGQVREPVILHWLGDMFDPALAGYWGHRDLDRATDVLQASSEPQDAKARATLFEHTMVRDLMTPDPDVIQPDADVREAAKHMLYADVRRLFIEDQGRLVGVITQTDIAHAVGTGRI